MPGPSGPLSGVPGLRVGWRRVAPVVAGVTAVVLTVGGCGRGDGDGGARLRVLAAASLAPAVAETADVFARQHPAVDVEVSGAGSGELVTQVLEGAPADVLVTADEPTMAWVADRDRLRGQPRRLARNRLVVVVEAGNPKGVRGLADLARPDVLVALGAPDVPVGRYAEKALRRAGVEVRPATREASVTGVLGKVALGEVDAGIVYATDVARAGGQVEAIALPDAHDVEVVDLVAVLDGADREAATFVAFLLGADGQAVFRRHGFLPA